MGSGCAMISNMGVLSLVVVQGQPSVCGQWTTCSQLSRTSNLSEEFELRNGVNVGTESNWSIELAVSISPGGPEPSSPMLNSPTGSTAQPYACGDARGKDNLPASSLICPDPVELPLRWIVRSVGPRALIAPGDEGLKAGRIPLECKLYNTQNESQPAAQPSLNSRKIQSQHTRTSECASQLPEFDTNSNSTYQGSPNTNPTTTHHQSSSNTNSRSTLGSTMTQTKQTGRKNGVGQR